MFNINCSGIIKNSQKILFKYIIKIQVREFSMGDIVWKLRIRMGSILSTYDVLTIYDGPILEFTSSWKTKVIYLWDKRFQISTFNSRGQLPNSWLILMTNKRIFVSSRKRRIWSYLLKVQNPNFNKDIGIASIERLDVALSGFIVKLSQFWFSISDCWFFNFVIF